MQILWFLANIDPKPEKEVSETAGMSPICRERCLPAEKSTLWLVFLFCTFVFLFCTFFFCFVNLSFCFVHFLPVLYIYRSVLYICLSVLYIRLSNSPSFFLSENQKRTIWCKYVGIVYQICCLLSVLFEFWLRVPCALYGIMCSFGQLWRQREAYKL